MKKSSHHQGNDGVYILTHDLGERIESLRLLGLKTPDAGDPFFASFHDKVKSQIGAMLPEASVVTYNMKQLAEKVWSEALRVKANLKDAIVVSSCAEVSSPRRGHVIEINRMVDYNGQVIGLGPRPGNSSLRNQLDGIASAVNGNSVVLAEDGAFTGSTMEYLLNELQRRRVNVAAIVIGICFPKAIDRIKQNFGGDIIVVQEVDKPHEWMPDHDFLPFSPNCGRVFGGVFGKEVLPVYTHEGLSYSFPYILPFGDPVSWASLPRDRAANFSLMCLQEALSLFSELDRLNGKKIRMRDLVGSTPRVSVPMTIGNGCLPVADMPISSFLGEVCHEF